MNNVKLLAWSDLGLDENKLTLSAFLF